jgi:hypothetical protein
LLGKCNRCRLNRTNPDWKKASSLDLLEQDYGLIGGHLNANPNYFDWDQHSEISIVSELPRLTWET